MADETGGAETAREHLGTGLALLSEGDVDAAAAHLQLAVFISPSSHYAREAAAAAATFFSNPTSTSTIEGDPSSTARGWNYLSLTLDHDNPGEHLVHLCRPRSGPIWGLVLAVRGRIEASEGRHVAALPLLAEAGHIWETTGSKHDSKLAAHAKFEAAMSAVTLGRPSTARRLLNEIVKRDPPAEEEITWKALLESARLAHENLDFADAERLLEQLEEEQRIPQRYRSEMLFIYGWALLRTDRFEKAARLLEASAREEHSKSCGEEESCMGRASYFAGRANLLAGHPEKADELWNALLDRHPYSYYAEMAAKASNGTAEKSHPRKSWAWLLLATEREDRNSDLDTCDQDIAHALELNNFSLYSPSRGHDDHPGSGANKTTEEPREPSQRSCQQRTKRLAEFLESYDGSMILALTRLHAGLVSLERWKNRSGHPPADFLLEEMPSKETRRYVREVISSARRYRLVCGEVDGEEVGANPRPEAVPYAQLEGSCHR